MTEETFEQRFSREIAKALVKKNVTQIELADAIGIRQASISNYISGKNAPRLATALKICAYLGIDLEVFI